MVINQPLVFGTSITNSEGCGRAILKYSDNETASYIPNFFLADGKKNLQRKYCSQPVESILRRVSVPHNLSTVVTALSDDIKNAMEVRIQIFVQQILVVMQTGYMFSKYNTKIQAGIKAKEKVDSAFLRTAETHAANLPSLMGMEKAVYLHQFMMSETKVLPQMIANGTSLDKGWNLTHLFPAFVNHVDSKIEEKTKVPALFMKTFRRFCTEILNRSAKGEISLYQALSIYLKKYDFMLTEIPRLKELALHKRGVLHLYQTVVQDYLCQIDLPKFWGSLLFSTDPKIIHQSLLGKITRELLLNNRYDELSDRCVTLIRSKMSVSIVQRVKEVAKCVLFMLHETDRSTIALKKLLEREESVSVLKYAHKCFLNSLLRKEAYPLIVSTKVKNIAKWTDREWRLTVLGEGIMKAIENRQPNHFRQICLRFLYLVSLQMCSTGKLAQHLQMNRYDILAKMEPDTAFTHHVMICLGDEKAQAIANTILNQINA